MKKMLNHKESGDVTAGYIHYEDAVLGEAWQKVADLPQPPPREQ